MGLIGSWVLRRVIASALTLERESLETYRRLRERAGAGAAAPQLSHLLQEEERHWRILEDAAAGRLDAAELERLVREHLYHEPGAIEPLEGATLADWGPELERALAQEEKTFVFYSNLRRISRIPVVRRAFEVISDMEHEHLEILRRLLGRAPGAASGPSATSQPAPGRSPKASTG